MPESVIAENVRAVVTHACLSDGFGRTLEVATNPPAGKASLAEIIVTISAGESASIGTVHPKHSAWGLVTSLVRLYFAEVPFTESTIVGKPNIPDACMFVTKLVVTVAADSGSLVYSVAYQGATVVETSSLGLAANGTDLGTGVNQLSCTNAQVTVTP